MSRVKETPLFNLEIQLYAAFQHLTSCSQQDDRGVRAA